MPVDIARVREHLRKLELQRLFVEGLNWANSTRRPVKMEVGDVGFVLRPVAEQGGMVVFEVAADNVDGIPDRATRLKLHQQLLPQAQEHILVFVNKPRTATCWVWVDRKDGKRVGDHHHRYHTSQPGDSLLQKLGGIAFEWDELDDEGRASIVQVTDRVRASLATDRVTKRFYDEFQRQHADFLGFIEGIEKLDDRRWYASVMLNRLMFIYFIQRKRFLDGDPAYLRSRLDRCRATRTPYYQGFLVPLFFEGFATKPEERSAEAAGLLGEIPYLNGGLFMPHQIEQSHQGIDIPDDAFVRIFDFFDRYQWHLDDRPLQADNEINPDVLGYIFEKYINQRQMGAYYTKEDITEYITRNTVLPFLFGKLGSFCPEAVNPLPVGDVDAYLFDAMRKGVDLTLPERIAAGLDSVPQRTHWNKAADPEFALPTETWREHIARRRRVEEIRQHFAQRCDPPVSPRKRGEPNQAQSSPRLDQSSPACPFTPPLLAGEGRVGVPCAITIDDFITYNLNIVQFAQDFLADTDDPQVIRRFYFQCLQPLTVLDPTCGSGAFLFAALNILEPLYELCLQRMEEFIARRQREREWAQPFETELTRLRQHPSRRYFIYKSIIVNNLFGVDIMDEAVEICKLRLFLKLVAQVDDAESIEPLPDIDFNIRAGNSLVGYATLEDIERAKAGKLDFGGIVDRVKAVDRLIRTFRDVQMSTGVSAQHLRESKDNLRAELRELEAELHRDLAFEYGANDLDAFIASHKPFHWYVEFYDILQHGGFDVVIGNPPYVEYSKVRGEYTVRGYETEGCGNLYAFCMERSVCLLGSDRWFGMIVPVASLGLDKTASLRATMQASLSDLWASSFAIRPSKLFDGVDHRLAVQVARTGTHAECQVRTTCYRRWHSDERATLFARLAYLDVADASVLGRPAKAASDAGLSVVRKMLGHQPLCESHIRRDGGSRFHYHRSPRYWIRAMDFEPHFRSATRRRSMHHFRDLLLSDRSIGCFVGAILNSSLYYFWFICYGNGRNIAGSDIKSVPIGTPSNEVLASAATLFPRLMQDYRAHSRLTVREDCEYQEFDASQSKPIIDEIDRVLAEHYGFTEEELDFIINYDIKYRMGGPEEGEGDE